MKIIPLKINFLINKSFNFTTVIQILNSNFYRIIRMNEIINKRIHSIHLKLCLLRRTRSLISDYLSADEVDAIKRKIASVASSSHFVMLHVCFLTYACSHVRVRTRGRLRS